MEQVRTVDFGRHYPHVRSAREPSDALYELVGLSTHANRSSVQHAVNTLIQSRLLRLQAIAMFYAVTIFFLIQILANAKGDLSLFGTILSLALIVLPMVLAIVVPALFWDAQILTLIGKLESEATNTDRNGGYVRRE